MHRVCRLFARGTVAALQVVRVGAVQGIHGAPLQTRVRRSRHSQIRKRGRCVLTFPPHSPSRPPFLSPSSFELHPSHSSLHLCQCIIRPAPRGVIPFLSSLPPTGCPSLLSLAAAIMATVVTQPPPPPHAVSAPPASDLQPTPSKCLGWAKLDMCEQGSPYAPFMELNCAETCANLQTVRNRPSRRLVILLSVGSSS